MTLKTTCHSDMQFVEISGDFWRLLEYELMQYTGGALAGGASNSLPSSVAGISPAFPAATGIAPVRGGLFCGEVRRDQT